MENFNHTCFCNACDMAENIHVDNKMSRICGRQANRENALLPQTGLPEKELVEGYFRINVAIPLLDEIIGSLQHRFAEGHEALLKGVLLLPAYVVSKQDWESHVHTFVQLYCDEIPSRQTIDAELNIWKQLWEERWQKKWMDLKDQHFKTTGVETTLTDAELTKLKFCSVPSTVQSALMETSQEMFPNILNLLSLLAVAPVTTCEAERSVSALRRLKTYMRRSMS